MIALKRALSFAVILVAGFAADLNGAFFNLDNWIVGARMSVLERAPTGEIVLVDIDSKSIAELERWPWPRRIHAELTDKLVALGVTDIAFDVDFSAVSNPADDAVFEAALARAQGAVLLAAFRQEQFGDGAVFNRPLDRFAQHAWEVSVNVRPDPDGVVRRYPYGTRLDGTLVPSNPVMLGGGIGKGDSDFLVDFSIGADRVDRIPVVDILNNEIAAERLSGKKVIVGAQAVELRDFFTVPGGAVMSGAMLQVIATETLKQERVLAPTGSTVTLLGLAVLALIALWLVGRNWLAAVVVLGATAILVEIGALVLQSVTPVVIVTGAWHVAAAALALAVLVHELDFRRLGQLASMLRANNAEAILSRVIRDNFAGVLVIDHAGVIRAASSVAADILGKNTDLVGRAADTILPPELVTKARHAATKRFADGMTLSGEISLGGEDEEPRILQFALTQSQQAALREGGSARPVVCLTFSDVTQERNARARIERLARFDTLTGLPNRNQFIEYLEEAVAKAANGGQHTVICFDLDGFKNVNDTLGHHIGDQLLAGVAARARDLFDGQGLVSRLGGDEFAIVVDTPRAAAAQSFAEDLVARLAEPFELSGHRVVIAASAGIALVSADSASADELIKHADVALYRAKERGGNCSVMFEPEMLAAIAERQQLELDLWRALDRDEFEVWYQPQVDLATGDICGAEALLRWHHPVRGNVSPAEFVPVAEAIGLVDRLGRWVLETACRDAAAWPKPVKLAVNVSSDQFARGEIADVVADALGKTGLDAGRLDIELTESVFMESSGAVRATLDRLRRSGVGVALDDFGTGYSSLSYLHQFPVDKIKIDRSFVVDLLSDDGTLPIVRAMTALATNIGVRLNAEGIEEEDQADTLRYLGVAEGQGFLFARPQTNADMHATLMAERELSQSA